MRLRFVRKLVSKYILLVTFKRCLVTSGHLSDLTFDDEMSGWEEQKDTRTHYVVISLLECLSRGDGYSHVSNILTPVTHHSVSDVIFQLVYDCKNIHISPSFLVFKLAVLITPLCTTAVTQSPAAAGHVGLNSFTSHLHLCVSAELEEAPDGLGWEMSLHYVHEESPGDRARPMNVPDNLRGGPCIFTTIGFTIFFARCQD